MYSFGSYFFRECKAYVNDSLSVRLTVCVISVRIKPYRSSQSLVMINSYPMWTFRTDKVMFVPLGWIITYSISDFLLLTWDLVICVVNQRGELLLKKLNTMSSDYWGCLVQIDICEDGCHTLRCVSPEWFFAVGKLNLTVSKNPLLQPIWNWNNLW